MCGRGEAGWEGVVVERGGRVRDGVDSGSPVLARVSYYHASHAACAGVRLVLVLATSTSWLVLY